MSIVQQARRQQVARIEQLFAERGPWYPGVIQMSLYDRGQSQRHIHPQKYALLDELVTYHPGIRVL